MTRRAGGPPARRRASSEVRYGSPWPSYATSPHTREPQSTFSVLDFGSLVPGGSVGEPFSPADSSPEQLTAPRSPIPNPTMTIRRIARFASRQRATVPKPLPNTLPCDERRWRTRSRSQRKSQACAVHAQFVQGFTSRSRSGDTVGRWFLSTMAWRRSPIQSFSGFIREATLATNHADAAHSCSQSPTD